MDDADFIRTWLRKLDEDQWLAPQDILRRQRQALERLLRHAKAHVPFYRSRLDSVIGSDSSVDWSRWRDIPLLTRTDVLEQRDELISRQIEAEEGELVTRLTSGSTGKPITAFWTQRELLRSLGLVHRSFTWHGADMSAKMAFIMALDGARARYPEAERHEFWTLPAKLLGIRGELAVLNVNTPVEQQIAWLRDERPRYLHTYPTNARALARTVNGKPVRGIEKLFLAGESLEDDVGSECGHAFGAEIVDRYGAIETGQLAVQCPTGSHYHVHGESVLLEVLHADGASAAPGEPGRVVVTPLYNAAFPLIRYELDDVAAAGRPCSCGRGLPVITRILGRSRHMFRFPDGSEIWPSLTTALRRFLAPRQWQVAQIASREIEVRFMPSDPTGPCDYDGLTAYIRDAFHQDVSVRYTKVDEFPAAPGGKFHDYVCEL